MIPSFDHTGPFIWAAYGLSAAVLAGLVVYVRWRAGAARSRLERLEAEDTEP